MKKTPFYDFHIALNAKMASFAGYEMPISYIGINAEHQAVRENVGVFDVSHMGEFILKGPNSLDLIQKITTNDAAKLNNNQAQYSCMTNAQGGIIDDLIVYCLDKNAAYMLVVNASNIEKDWNWLKQNNTNKVEMHNISNQTALLAVQGPNAKTLLQPYCNINLQEQAYYHFAKCEFMGIKNVLISSTGYTGSGGVEIYFECQENAVQTIWQTLVNELKIQPIGLAARDTLRLEKGYCLYGNDIDDTTNPLEAGLSWITKWSKDFVAKDILLEIKSKGIHRSLVGFVMEEKGIPRSHYDIVDKDKNKIGYVTSGTHSPTLNIGLGLGYVDLAFSKIGTEIFILIRDTPVKAQVQKLG